LYLIENGETDFQELVRVIPLHHATYHRHLGLLRRHNIVHAREEVPNTFYRINPGELRHAVDTLDRLVAHLESFTPTSEEMKELK